MDRHSLADAGYLLFVVEVGSVEAHKGPGGVFPSGPSLAIRERHIGSVVGAL